MKLQKYSTISPQKPNSPYLFKKILPYITFLLLNLTLSVSLSYSYYLFNPLYLYYIIHSLPQKLKKKKINQCRKKNKTNFFPLYYSFHRPVQWNSPKNTAKPGANWTPQPMAATTGAGYRPMVSVFVSLSLPLSLTLNFF